MSNSYAKIKNTIASQFTKDYATGPQSIRFDMLTQSMSYELAICGQVKIYNKAISIFNWNMLADDFLTKLFNLIPNTYILNTQLKLKTRIGNVYSDQADLLLFELGDFLYQHGHIAQNQLTITNELLTNFGDFNLTGSRAICDNSEELLIQSRQEVVDLFSSDDDYRHVYKQLLIKSTELIHHIQGQEAILQWQQRFTRFAANPKATKGLLQASVTMLQQCSNPRDIIQLFKSNKPDTKFIVYNNNSTSSPSNHVMITFDSTVLELIGKPLVMNIENKWPAVLCLLQLKGTNKRSIFGSIGSQQLLSSLPDVIHRAILHLQQQCSDTPYIIGGIYSNGLNETSHRIRLYSPYNTLANAFDQNESKVAANLDIHSVRFSPKVTLQPPNSIPPCLLFDLRVKSDWLLNSAEETLMPFIPPELKGMLDEDAVSAFFNLAHDDDDIDERVRA